MNNLSKLIALSILSLSINGCFDADRAIKQTDKFIEKQKIDTQKTSWKTQLTQPEIIEFTKGKDYFWDLQTSQGDISIKLLPNVAPMHVSSTIYLTQLGFYDDLIFHRVIPGFMAQGGDPLGTGQGNPGYRYQGEFSKEATHSKAGILSMANAGPGTDGSQFFITFKATPFLNGRHTVFGEVVKGLDDSLAKIEALGSRSGRTESEVKIIKAAIRVEDSTS
ncbi:peptidylprolyl isomerase [Pseudoalteromonas denitrificans]|uniref:Peptidyl-prolyl cis-trans isomerase n=1 Tax=Pseudoalteromonas denitrificans DSM 6059 TaxID=1123010 RepID=A0A1I1MJ45_9GAMM|nr:peptidylprolyl isomerase [Pseudoalteromonas denitrificans]SFC85429.1 peptidylprolyl isomerase [Pseudoalteromonas denitrificans DSM 6059]